MPLNSKINFAGLELVAKRSRFTLFSGQNYGWLCRTKLLLARTIAFSAGVRGVRTARYRFAQEECDRRGRRPVSRLLSRLRQPRLDRPADRSRADADGMHGVLQPLRRGSAFSSIDPVDPLANEMGCWSPLANNATTRR
jgi:hypothetical protein